MKKSIQSEKNPVIKNNDFKSFFIWLTIMVVVLVVTAVVAVAFGLQRQREITINSVKGELYLLSNALASQNRSVIDNSKSLLITLSASPELTKSHQECVAYLKSQIRQHTQYTSFSLVDPKGNVLCSSADLQANVNFADRDYFKEATNTKKFTVGSFQTGRLTGLPVLPISYPILDAKGNISSMIVSGVDLNWLSNTTSELDLPVNSVVLSLDSNGVVITSTDEKVAIGSDARDIGFVKDNLGKTDAAIGPSTGIDGIHRIYSLREAVPGGKSYVLFGLTDEKVSQRFDEITLRASLLFLFLGLVGLLCTWLLSKKFLLNQITTGREQVSELEKENNDLYYSLIENAPDPILTVDPKGVITGANRAGMELSGLKKDQIVGHSFMKMTKLVTPESLVVATKHFLGMLKGQKTDRDYQITLITKGNIHRKYDVATSEIRVGDKIKGYQVTLRDISRLSEINESLTRRTSELERLNKIMSSRELEMARLKKENAELKKKLK